MKELDYSKRFGTLFSGEAVIVIPDLQREYCWPTRKATNNATLVENFLKSCDDSENSFNSLGMLYYYESPRNMVQLCDGQQRLTTLFLLICYIYQKISRCEDHDKSQEELLAELGSILVCGGEPRLRYAIRETTLFFLHDFVLHGIKDGQLKDCRSETIRTSDWYCNDYDVDPSIQNILVAFDTFSDYSFQTDLTALALRICQTEFVMFDMMDRHYGEQQFVVLNTTGRALSKTENLKPLLLGGWKDDKLKQYAEEWEEIEQFFWESKIDRNQSPAPSDTCIIEFLRRVFIIENFENATGLSEAALSDASKFDVTSVVTCKWKEGITQTQKSVALDTIDKYFRTLQWMVSSDLTLPELTKLLCCDHTKSIECFYLLPIIKWVCRYVLPEDKKNEHLGMYYTSIQRFFLHRSWDEDIAKDPVPATISALKIESLIEDGGDIASLAYNAESKKFGKILNDEYRYKLRVLLECGDDYGKRISTEEMLCRADEIPCLKGDLTVLLDFLGTDVMCAKTLDPRFADASVVVGETLGVEVSDERCNDVRAALLTFGDYSTNEGSYFLGIRQTYFTRYVIGGESARALGHTAKAEMRSMGSDSKFRRFLKAILEQDVVVHAQRGGETIVDEERTREKIGCLMKRWISEYAIDIEKFTNSNLLDRTLFVLAKNPRLFSWMGHKRIAICNDEAFLMNKSKGSSTVYPLLPIPWQGLGADINGFISALVALPHPV